MAAEIAEEPQVWHRLLTEGLDTNPRYHNSAERAHEVRDQPRLLLAK